MGNNEIVHRLEFIRDCECGLRDKQAINTAIDAVKKQEPKEPIWDGHCWRCPVCKRGVCGETYCGTCGQALDWTEVEE